MTPTWYEVVRKEVSPPDRVEFRVLIHHRDTAFGLPSRGELAGISSSLKFLGGSRQRTYVLFYLPGMDIEGVAYASAHRTPDLQRVDVNYFTITEDGSPAE